MDVFLMFWTGFICVMVSIWPTLISLPSQSLYLHKLPGGRIITLIFFATIFLWILMLREREKTSLHKDQIYRMVRNMATEKFRDTYFKDISNCSILIVLPAYNEAENLKMVLPRIPKVIHGFETTILVVDDGSQDLTEDVVKERHALVASHIINQGGGAALKTGFEIARLLNASFVVTMDADGQHNPDEIESLVLPLINDEADVVIGSRVLGSSDKYSSVRSMGVHVFNGIINTLMGIRITDCASGFRSMRSSALFQVQLDQEQYHTAELIIDAAKKNLRVTERPIHIAARFEGESKKGKNTFYAVRFLRTVLLTWWR